jgi:hypothetical protein
MKFSSVVKACMSLLLISAVAGVEAQEYKFAAHVGALGTAGTSSEGTIGYGVHFLAVPSGWAGLQLDATFGQFNAGTYFGTSPALVLYPADLGELKMGVLFGAGFHKFPSTSMKFALHTGINGDFNVSDNVAVGLMTRYHFLFDADDIYDVMLTFGYKFEVGGGW